jgi:hypothetical protein
VLLAGRVGLGSSDKMRAMLPRRHYQVPVASAVAPPRVNSNRWPGKRASKPVGPVPLIRPAISQRTPEHCASAVGSGRAHHSTTNDHCSLAPEWYGNCISAAPGVVEAPVTSSD